MAMIEVDIKKAKLKGDGMVIHYQETTSESMDVVVRECYTKVHDDMVAAFEKLDVHIARLCEQIPPSADIANLDAAQIVLLKNISCSGYSIGGEDEHEGVTLIGRRTLSNGKVLNLVSPFQKWEDEFTPYDYSSALAAAVKKIDEEVHMYMFEDKHAPEPQMELEFPEG